MSHPFPTFIVGQSPPSAILQFSSLLFYLYNLCCSFFTLSSSPPTPVSFFPSLPAPTPGQAECAADISIAQSLRVVFLPFLPPPPFCIRFYSIHFPFHLFAFVSVHFNFSSAWSVSSLYAFAPSFTLDGSDPFVTVPSWPSDCRTTTTT